jgi:cobalamin synthase
VEQNIPRINEKKNKVLFVFSCFRNLLFGVFFFFFSVLVPFFSNSRLVSKETRCHIYAGLCVLCRHCVVFLLLHVPHYHRRSGVHLSDTGRHWKHWISLWFCWYVFQYFFIYVLFVCLLLSGNSISFYFILFSFFKLFNYCLFVVRDGRASQVVFRWAAVWLIVTILFCVIDFYLIL